MLGEIAPMWGRGYLHWLGRGSGVAIEVRWVGTSGRVHHVGMWEGTGIRGKLMVGGRGSSGVGICHRRSIGGSPRLLLLLLWLWLLLWWLLSQLFLRATPIATILAGGTSLLLSCSRTLLLRRLLLLLLVLASKHADNNRRLTSFGTLRCGGT